METSLLPLVGPDSRLRLYLDTADVILLLLDGRGRIREINRKGCELLGFAERELLGSDWFETCVPAHLRAIARERFAARLAGAAALPARFESAAVTRDGQVRRIAWRDVLVRDMEGVVLGCLRSGEDVTERHASTLLFERLANGGGRGVGEDFLRGLAAELVEALGARAALIAELTDDGDHLRVRACHPPDPFASEFVLPLLGSPLLAPAGSDLRLVESGALLRFADDPLLRRLDAEGLVAISLRGTDDALVGCLAVVFDRALGEPALAQAVARLFGSRAGGELERLREERRLHAAMELAEVTLQSIGDAVITTDTEGWVTGLNPAAERLLGWHREEAVGLALSHILRLVDERSGDVLPDPVEHCFRQAAAVALPEHTMLIARDGSERGVSDTAAPIRDRHGNVIGAVLVFQDVTEARHMAKTLAHRAAHDALTGLPNRLEFERRLEAAWQDAASRPVQHALCYIDLDQFKVVNDVCGHAAGDELLRQLAHVLRRKIRASDLLARLGGDEFGLLLDGCPLERGQQIAEQICRAVRDFRFTWDGRVFELGASIGVVPVTAAERGPSSLLARADVACYAAKDAGRNRVHVDRAGDPELVRRHFELSQLSALLAGLEKGRFGLVFQPIVPLTGGTNGVRGEVLLRWKDEAGRYSPAASFIPAAERYNLMPTVDRWVVRQTVAFFGELYRAGRAIEAVSINLSSNTLADPTFGEVVRGALAESGLPPDRVWFEITETAAINNLAQAVELMEMLRALGCRFALDDFGSGLSSFRLLRTLPVESLKIDGSFVRGMQSDRVDRAVVEATTRVAHAMRISTVAEWVEYPDLLPRLRELGIDYAQGIAVGMPVPLERLRTAGEPAAEVAPLRPSPLVVPPERSRLDGPH